MNRIFCLIICFILFLGNSCTKPWEDHYEKVYETADMKLWDALQDMEQYSEFLKYAELNRLDTIIKSDNTKTLFIPDNEAFERYLQGDTVGFAETMSYLITPSLFMLRHIRDYYKLQTLDKKYALISHLNNSYYFDNTEIIYTSPVFLDGKYYVIEDVAVPLPNLYQYIQRNNPAVKRYIDSRDSIALDRERSKPLYYNEFGQTVYDSVTTIINRFEEKYFAVSKEFRNIAATIVIPDQTSYEGALNVMAMQLGGKYTSFADIPADWQNNELIPDLLHNGIFGGIQEPEFFTGKKLVNIIGDSIEINYNVYPDSRFISSNGLAYNYTSFHIDEKLYKNKKVEGEDLVNFIGLGNFVWDDKLVTVEGDKRYQPVKQRVAGASNDTVISVKFPNNYNTSYAVTFSMKRVFPGKYRLVWRTNHRDSGRYSIYVNGKKIKIGLFELDQFDTFDLRTGFYSVLGYMLFPDRLGYCNVDCWVNIEEYGDITIKLEYLGRGGSSSNGLSIDYLELLFN